MKKEVMTHKSGKFVFSNVYSKNIIAPLLIELKIRYQILGGLPILPALATKLNEDLILRSIFGTAAIEGNPLSEKEVGSIVADPAIDLKEKAAIEINNLKNAFGFLQEVKYDSKELELTEKLIKDIHSIITKDIPDRYNTPGQYRNTRVKVGDLNHGGVYTPPKCLDDIKMLMSIFVEWINSKEIIHLGPIVRACFSHYYIGLIHPFGDGNGRTARMVEALMLRAAGYKFVPYMLSNYYYKHIDDYFIAFSSAYKNPHKNTTPFLGFVLRGFSVALQELEEKITFYVRKFALSDYLKFLRSRKQITSRQYDLLNILLSQAGAGITFSVNDLYNLPTYNILYRNVSQQTAIRDIKKLHSINILNFDSDKKKYFLNFRMLDAIAVQI